MAQAWENHSEGREWIKPQPYDAPMLDGFPYLETERVILREPRLRDWDQIGPIYTADRSKFIGGPFTEMDGWLDYCQLIAGWTLRGFGCWIITTKQNDTAVGLVLLAHEVFDAEMEIGWLMTEAGEGHGYVSESAKAVLNWAFDIRKVPSIVSYMDGGNLRSAAVAERIGGSLDPNAWRHIETDKVYRYNNPRIVS